MHRHAPARVARVATPRLALPPCTHAQADAHRLAAPPPPRAAALVLPPVRHLSVQVLHYKQAQQVFRSKHHEVMVYKRS